VKRTPLLLAASALLVAGCTAQSPAAEGTTAHASGTSAAGGSSGQDTSASGTRSGSTSSPAGLAGDGVVSRSEFTSAGRTWPLTVSQGTLFCESGTQIIFTTGNGSAYGVNDAAQGAGEWNDIDAIRAKVDGHPADLGDLAAAGQQLC
jgi:hypothetical protein